MMKLIIKRVFQDPHGDEFITPTFQFGVSVGVNEYFADTYLSKEFIDALLDDVIKRKRDRLVIMPATYHEPIYKVDPE